MPLSTPHASPPRTPLAPHAPRHATADPMLEALEVSYHFDVSKPALQRIVTREPRRSLRAVTTCRLP
jgi:hypothetical protein